MREARIEVRFFLSYSFFDEPEADRFWRNGARGI
jgi:hypothetical protein